MARDSARFIAAAANLAGRGDAAGAERLCGEILEVFPEDASALHLLAMLRRSGDGPAEEVIGLLERAHAADPGRRPVALDLADALVRAGRTDEARAVLAPVDDPGADAIEDRLRLAYLLADAGERVRAEAILRDTIARDPTETGPALELLKLLAADERGAEAEGLLRGWIAAVAPARVAAFELALASVEEARLRWTDAQARLERLVADDPAAPEPSLRLARLHTLHGRYSSAVDVLEEALAQNPDHRQLTRELAKSLMRVGEPRRHLDLVQGYAQKHPDDLWALIALADSLVSVGDRTRFLPIVDRALERDPGLDDRLGCALVLARARAVERAAAIVDTVPAIPTLTNGQLSALGQTCVEIGRIDEGIACFREIFRRAPENLTAAGHLATWLFAQNHHALGIEILEEQLQRHASNANLAQNLAMMHLQIGNFAAGFRHYGAVYRRDPYRAKFESYRPPLWNGTPLPEGERLLVWADQGIGDQIIYANFFETLAARQPFDAEIESRLAPLMARSFPWLRVRSRTEIEDDYGLTEAYAAHLPLCMLPGLMMRSRADIPPARAYLRPDPDRVAALREEILDQTGGRPLVGLSWRSVNAHIGRYKTTRLKDWEAVLTVPGVTFVALQYGEIADDLREVETALGMTVHEAAVDRFRDIEGMAALIAAMDAVVSTSNTNAHMAGALGVPALTLLGADPGLLWYWFRDDDTSPWYPRMDLVRQAVPGLWTPVFARAGAWLSARFPPP